MRPPKACDGWYSPPNQSLEAEAQQYGQLPALHPHPQRAALLNISTIRAWLPSQVGPPVPSSQLSPRPCLSLLPPVLHPVAKGNDHVFFLLGILWSTWVPESANF